MPRQVASGQGHFARLLRADGEADGVEVCTQFLQGEMPRPISTVGLEGDALRAQLLDSTGDALLGEFEIRDAIDHQPADRVVALEHSHRLSGAIELLRGGQPSGPLPTTATCLPVRDFAGGSGTIQPSAQPTIDNCALDTFNGDRFGVD